MTALSFNVRGVACPFARVSPGKNGNVFESRHYRQWKSQIMDAAREAADRAAWATTDAAVRVDVTIVLMRRPTKKPRKSESAHPIVEKSCGDVDNFAKGLLDGMQRALVFKNDAQVVQLLAHKRWQAPREEFAGAIVRVEIVE